MSWALGAAARSALPPAAAFLRTPAFYAQRCTSSRRNAPCRRLASSPSLAACAAATPTKSISLAGDEHVAETEAKKSRFVAWAWPVKSPEDAMQLIAARSDPSASHNCFAFKTGQHYRSSDDGEPGGTAGRPILGVIEGEGLDGVAVLVTRYYGGIKLGTGGLVRAYSAAARAVLQAAPRVEITPRVLVRVLVPFECLGAAHQAAEAAKARRVSEEYSARSGEGGTADGMELVLEIDADGVHGLREAMREGSAGRIEVEVVGGKGDGV